MRRRLLLAALAVAAAIPLVYILASRLDKPAARLALYLLWFGNLVFSTFPQVVYWILLLGVALVVAAASLSGWRRRSAHRLGPRLYPATPVQLVARSVRRAATGPYFQWQMAQHLSGLIVEAATGREVSALSQEALHAAVDRLEAPAQVRAYLEAGLWGRFWGAPGPISRLKRLLSREQAASPLDVDLEQIVDYLESQMEVRR